MTKEQKLQLIFHRDTLSLIVSLFFLWSLISLLVDGNYRLKDLTKHSGQLAKIDSVITRVKNKPLFKETTKELRLTLDNEKDYFTSITTKDFGGITSKISIGDTVTIFTKNKLWGIFGMKQARDISHFTIGNIVLIDYENYRQTIPVISIISLAGSIGFFIFFYVRTRQRYILNILDKPNFAITKQTQK
jgi:hypothetical protein